MKRFVGAALEEFESFFGRADAASFQNAVYPPCCRAKSGPLCFRPVRAGGVIVDVKRCDVEPSGDFRLDMLFATGSSPFADAIDLGRFWNGPLADAFGLPRGPLPERAQQSLLDDLHEALPQPEPAAAPAKPAAARRRIPSADDLANRLAKVVRGQDTALRSFASLVVSQLAKRYPQRPGTALLIGPTGVGKTATVEALPAALADSGWPGAHVHRIDCNELTDDYDVHRFLGSAPGLVGYTKTPPLATALQREGCIVLLDEIEKAHPAVQEALFGLLDAGRVMAPDGIDVRAPGTIVVMTSAAAADELMVRLHQVVLENRRMIDRVVRAHLRDERWPDELLGRIDTLAVYRPLEEGARLAAAESAIRALAQEYGFTVAMVPSVITAAVVDIAEDEGLGARGLYFAARQLLADAFTAGAIEGDKSVIALEAGPPPIVIPAG